MIRELWVRFLAGETLSGEEQRVLVAALEADPELRAELLEDVQFDGALRALGDARRSGAAFAASVVDCVGPERDATRFLRKVEARLAEAPADPAGGGHGSRSNLPRVSRRFTRRPATGEGWTSAAAAAAAFLAIVLLATAFTKPAPRPLVKAPPPPHVLPEPREEAVPAPEESLPPAPKADVKPLTAEEVEEIERRMREMIRPATAPVPEKAPAPPLPAPAPKSEPAPAPAPPSTRPERAVALDLPVFLKVKEAYVGRATAKNRAVVNKALEPNQDLWVNGSAELSYPDGTTLEVGANSVLRDISDAEGRKVLLAHGTLDSRVAKQESGRPMVFVTPHARAVVLGTVLRLSADKAGTTLEVKEGRVRLESVAGGRASEVGAGAYATASDPTPRVAFPEAFTVNFGPSDTRLPGDGRHFNDSGAPFDLKRGYGWDGPQTGDFIPGALWLSGGVRVPKRAGREAVLRVRDPASTLDVLQRTDIVAGWGAHFETWRIQVPNGVYELSLCVGDATFEQGPHHVNIEGQQFVDRQLTRPNSKPFILRTGVVRVADGELTMKVGGYPDRKDSVDESKDTLLNFLKIKRMR